MAHRAPKRGRSRSRTPRPLLLEAPPGIVPDPPLDDPVVIGEIDLAPARKRRRGLREIEEERQDAELFAVREASRAAYPEGVPLLPPASVTLQPPPVPAGHFYRRSRATPWLTYVQRARHFTALRQVGRLSMALRRRYNPRRAAVSAAAGGAAGPPASFYTRLAARIAARRVRYPRVTRPVPLIKGAIAPYAGQRELKYIDTAWAADFAFPAAPAAVQPLNLIAEGDDNVNRNGRLVTIRSVEIRGSITPRVAGGPTDSQNCRIVIVWDNSVNSGTLPLPSAIFTSLVQGGNTGAAAESLPLIDNASRFSILSDETISMGAFSSGTANTNLSGSPTVAYYHKFLPINATTRYSGTSATIGAIANGGLYVVLLSDVAGIPAGVTSYVLFGNARVRFNDG